MNLTALDIRPATAADHAAVRTVTAAAFAQYEGVLAPIVFARYMDDLLDIAARLDERGEVLVGEVGEEIVGAVTFYADGGGLGMAWPVGWSVFRALAVTPQRRTNGAGRALVEACVERAGAAGAPVLGLHTASFMTSAVALYERCGFQRVPAFDISPADVIDVGGHDGLPRVIAYRRGVADAFG